MSSEQIRVPAARVIKFAIRRRFSRIRLIPSPEGLTNDAQVLFTLQALINRVTELFKLPVDLLQRRFQRKKFAMMLFEPLSLKRIPLNAAFVKLEGGSRAQKTANPGKLLSAAKTNDSNNLLCLVGSAAASSARRVLITTSE